MGETDEKENVPAGTPTEIEEPKETEKLLNSDPKKADIDSPTDAKSDISTADETTKSVDASVDKEKINGDEIIDIPDNEANEKKSKEEGREVKPKKIPIGGIKMPGFFTRNKSKPSENDGAEGELLENAGNEAKADEAAKDEEAGTQANARSKFFSSLPPLPQLPRIRNPFAKKAAPKDEETGDAKAADDKADANDTEANTDEKRDAEEKPEKEPLTENAAETEQKPAAPKRNLLASLPQIHLPKLSAIIPKRLRANNQQSDDLELGGPNNKAGLASMETLDDSIKDNDTNKDVTDKATIQDEGLETVKLNDSDKEKEAAKDNGKVGETEVDKRPYLERLRAYNFSVDDLAIIGGILVFVLLVAVICVFTFSGNPALKTPPLRDGKFISAVTSCGPVEGVLEDTTAHAFRGIPYGLHARFQPAQPIERIENCFNGTLKAHNATAACSQILANGSVIGQESCLTLDVITPFVRYENPLPVVVLIGADSFIGDSPNKLRPSVRFARAKDVIFVRPNFRLGIFGFLALDTLSQQARPPRSGNYALTDILAALRWIEVNIQNFGGDKDNVVLVGHRAGATIVSALVTSPKAKGLFSRAWVSSGSALFPGKPLADSERANAEFKETSKCDDDASCLTNTTNATDLLNSVPDTWRKNYADLPAINENTSVGHEWLVLDGDVLQQHPSDVWSRELSSPPKMVIGTTAHESHSDKLFNKHKEWTPQLVKEHIQGSKIGQLGLTDEVLKRYNATYQGLVQIISDIRTVCPLLTNARSQPSVPFYVVTQTGGGLDIADVDADIQAILGRYEPKTYEQRRYVSAIQQLFYHYVSHGELKQHEPNKRVLDIGQDALSIDDYPNCNFWISHDFVPRNARLD